MRNQSGAASLRTKNVNAYNNSNLQRGARPLLYHPPDFTKFSSLVLWVHLAAVASSHHSHAPSSDQAGQRYLWMPKTLELCPKNFGQGVKYRGVKLKLWVLSSIIARAWLFGLSDMAQRVESMILGWQREIWHGGLGVEIVRLDEPICSQPFLGRLMHLRKLFMG